MPSLPLDKDQNDTVMIGLDLDLTNSGSYHHTTASGELQELSSLPIMYAYASDGTVVGWYLLNTSGNVYHGMVKGSTMSLGAETPSTITREPSSGMHTTPSVSPSAPTDADAPFGQATPATAQPNVLTPPNQIYLARKYPISGARRRERQSRPLQNLRHSASLPSANPRLLCLLHSVRISRLVDLVL